MARDRKRKGWLSSLLGGRDDPPGTRYELVVIDGADAGFRYEIDRPRIQIGRRVPGSTNTGGIELNDKSVSGRHAIIGWEDGQVTVEHLPSATNPTLVNGRKVTRKRVRGGDRIVLGLVVLELRAIHPEPEAEEQPIVRPVPGQVETDPINARAELVLREGIDGLAGARFPLVLRRTAIGRDEDCEIVLDVASISRNHAALVWEDDHLVLIHESAVNPSHVNGMQVRDRRRVFHGDEIALSESIVFDVRLETSEVPAPEAVAAADDDDANEEVTRLTSPPDTREDETRITRAHAAALPESDGDAEKTRIMPLPEMPEDDAERTRIAPAPGAASPAPEAPVEDPGATRVDVEPTAPENEATRVDAPESPPELDRGRFREGDRTRLAPPPSRSRYADAEVTRIAPLPPGLQDAPSRDGAPGPDEEAGRSRGDADATVVRPAPSFDAPEDDTPESDATRVTDLDAELAREAAEESAEEDAREAKTMIRPSPVSDAEKTVVRPVPGSHARRGDDDAAATVVRPRPKSQRPPAETVILEPEDDDADDD